MRTTFTFLILLASFASQASTLAQMTLKKNMLSRTDTILSKISETQEDLKLEKYEEACEKIKDLYGMYPDHVEDIGVHMNIMKGNVYQIRNDSLQQLMFFHKQTLICKSGEKCENIDPKYISSELKKITKSVTKQKKAISKDSMEYENSFHYEYEL
jgi:hypothetical protein